MDCFIKSIKFIVDTKLLDCEFVFLTNYSVTKFWIDYDTAHSFDIPIIFPSNLHNFSDINLLYPSLKFKKHQSFEEFIAYIKGNINNKKMVTRLDRYYLDYIEPKAHMGAHYIVIQNIFDNQLEFYDTIDNKIHLICIDDFRIAVESKAPASLGYFIISNDNESILNLKITKETYLDIINNRVTYLRKANKNILDYINNNLRECNETLVLQQLLI